MGDLNASSISRESRKTPSVAGQLPNGNGSSLEEQRKSLVEDLAALVVRYLRRRQAATVNDLEVDDG
jgi:hypothetical protein